MDPSQTFNHLQQGFDFCSQILAECTHHAQLPQQLPVSAAPSCQPFKVSLGFPFPPQQEGPGSPGPGQAWWSMSHEFSTFWHWEQGPESNSNQTVQKKCAFEPLQMCRQSGEASLSKGKCYVSFLVNT